MSPAVWVDDLVPDVCWRLVGAQPIGRLGFVAADLPRIYPVNHRVDGETIVFRTEGGAAIEALLGGPPVVFEVDDADPTAETGWSVLVTGHLESIEDEAAREALSALDVHAWAPGKDRWVRLRPMQVSGRAISRRREADGRLVPYRP
jgi:nitroimidazol reductase NimA-like FMN-containing flavoprotein (pyridoxamine 5'-phosphate oxidase superfamily)